MATPAMYDTPARLQPRTVSSLARSARRAGGREMTSRLLGVLGVVGLIAAVAGLLTWTPGPADRGHAASAAAGRTAWGDPDLQGIWTDPYQTPLQRPPQFAGKEIFTDEERAA